MLVKIESEELPFFGYTERAGEIDKIHESHCNSEGRGCNDGAANELGLQQSESTVIEKAIQRGGVVGAGRTAGSVLAAGKQPQR